jgi:hypothetical protein
LISKNINIKKYRTTILLVLYECESWSLPLCKECRLRVFWNRVLGSIFGLKRDRVTGNGENYTLKNVMICTPHQILFGRSKREEWNGRACNVLGEKRGAYRVVVGKPEGKSPLGRPRRRWEVNMKMVLLEVG